MFLAACFEAIHGGGMLPASFEVVVDVDVDVGTHGRDRFSDAFKRGERGDALLPRAM